MCERELSQPVLSLSFFKHGLTCSVNGVLISQYFGWSLYDCASSCGVCMQSLTVGLHDGFFAGMCFLC